MNRPADEKTANKKEQRFLLGTVYASPLLEKGRYLLRRFKPIFHIHIVIIGWVVRKNLRKNNEQNF